VCPSIASQAVEDVYIKGTNDVADSPSVSVCGEGINFLYGVEGGESSGVLIIDIYSIICY
jgi:hypothetical protein